MNCKNCNAVMRVDENRRVFVCPYCESIEPFDNVSKDELQGMLHKAMSDVRKQSVKEAKEALAREALQKERTKGQKILDGIITVLQILFCLFLLFGCTGLFFDFVLVGIVSVIQLILMIAAMIMKKKWRSTGAVKFHRIKTVCLILVASLAVIWFYGLVNADDYSLEKETWPTQGLGSTIPEPGGRIRYQYSNNTEFSATIRKVSKTTFDAYVKACKEAGYVVDEEAGDTDFVAYHEKTDNKLTIRYYKYSKEIHVTVDKAFTMTDHWPTSEVASMIPKPEKDSCYVAQLSSSNLEVYVGDLTHDEFLQYVMKCQEEGFDGSYGSRENYFYANKYNVTLQIEFIRKRIMAIRVSLTSY